MLPLLLLATAAVVPPELTLVSPSRIGSPLVYQLSGSVGGPGVEALFLDTAAIPGGLPLGSFGTLYVGTGPAFTVLPGDGTHQWSVPVPALPSLVGKTIFAQAIALKPPGSVNDFVLSNLAVTTLQSDVQTFTRFALTSEPFEGTVSAYAVDGTDTRWRPRGHLYLGGQPRSLAAHPHKDRVYVTRTTSKDIARLALDPTTGSLTLEATTALGHTPRAIVIEPSGRYAYVGRAYSGNVDQFSIDPASGALTPLVPSSMPILGPTSDVVVTPTGSHLFALVSGSAAASAFVIDPSSGRLSPLSPVALVPDVSALAFSESAPYAYAVGSTKLAAYGFDPVTGSLTITMDVPLPEGTFASALAVQPGGQRLFVADSGQSRLLEYELLPAGGIGHSPLSVVEAPGNPSRLAVDATGGFLFALTPASSSARTWRLEGTATPPAPHHEVRTRGPSMGLALVRRSAPPTFTTPHVYVALEGAGEVRGFAVDPSAGNLAPLAGGVTATAPGPIGLALHPFVPFGLSANFSGHSVTRLSLQPNTGVPVALGSTSASAGAPFGVAIEPSGRFAYVSLAGGQAVLPYSLNAAAGQCVALTPVPVTPLSFPRGVAVEPTGRFLYVAESLSGKVRCFRIDAASGALSSIGLATAGAGVFHVAVEPSGRFLYAANNSAASLSQFAIDPLTGLLSPLSQPTVPAGSGPFEIAIDPRGRFAYAANGSSNNVSIYRIDGDTGALIPSGSFPVVADPRHLVVDASGRFLYVVNRSAAVLSVLRIDQATGALSGVHQIVAGGALPRGIVARQVME